ncbi:MAG: SUMF1/EgtB/PvdO family nonheme iron enzyme [Alistipes sp.]|jgi:formylglycine-generating enzyme required for sulfatase activity|nr:SUMF1/EgtB/PvdO family nonheme iron enzyme [Alistipes sp.]
MKKFYLVSALALGAVATMNLSACDDHDPGPGPEPVPELYTVTVISDVSGAAGASVADSAPAASVEASEGAEITLSAASFPALAYEGYNFVKWTVVGDGDIEFSPNAQASTATFIMPAADITIEAVFEAVPPPGEELGIETVKIPAGTFLMGSPEDEPSRQDGINPITEEYEAGRDNENQHEVTLTSNFFMSKYEITNAQYAAFLNAKEVAGESITQGYESKIVANCTWGDNTGKALVYDSSHLPWADFGIHWIDGAWLPAEGYDNHPVILVTWFGATEYAAWAGGALPTEAQWEYAARGGVEAKPFGIGDGTRLTADMANFYAPSPYDVAQGGQYDDMDAMPEDITKVVGSYDANGYGLHDMHGNVWEWCEDWFEVNYGATAGASATDPVVTEPNQWNQKIAKGGSYYDGSKYCRSAYRDFVEVSFTDEFRGFRIVFNM